MSDDIKSVLAQYKKQHPQPGHSYVNAKYTIELNGDSSTPTEVALTEFMSGVFDLAKKSNCIGHGLTITRTELED